MSGKSGAFFDKREVLIFNSCEYFLDFTHEMEQQRNSQAVGHKTHLSNQSLSESKGRSKYRERWKSSALGVE